MKNQLNQKFVISPSTFKTQRRKNHYIFILVRILGLSLKFLFDGSEAN